MKLKKLLCLLLALLLVCSMAACGDAGNSDDCDKNANNPNGDPETPTSSVAPEDDTIWVLVQESDMGSSRYNKYIYDENGNRIGGEFYNDNKKTGDYQYVTTQTASGGKIVEVSYKHVKDSEFSKRNDYEYDASGKLIRVVDYDYRGDVSGVEYTFTYNENGQLVEQVHTDNGEVQKKLTFVYDGDKLVEGHYWDKSENYGHYIYTYDENGIPVSADVETYYMDEQKYTLEFVADSGYDWWRLDTTDECDRVVGGRRLFFFEESADYGQKPHRIHVSIKTWGVFCTGWVPLVAFGCTDPSNYFIGAAELYYEPLDVHLAKQAENK